MSPSTQSSNPGKGPGYAQPISSWQQVTSSWVDAVRVSGNNLQVRVQLTGQVYTYGGAAGELPALLAAPSHGTFVNQAIKPHYPVI
jgi:hypothetical protein